MKNKIEVYSGQMCPYCSKAKDLLKKKNISFEEFDIKKDSGKLKEMLKRTGGARTIPQIFINDVHIGGCDDLYLLESSGALNEYLDS